MMKKSEYQDLLYKTMSKKGPEAMSEIYHSLSDDERDQLAEEMIFLLDWMWQKNKSYGLERFGSKYVQNSLFDLNLASDPADDLPASEEIFDPRPPKQPGKKSGKNRKSLLDSPNLEEEIIEHDPIAKDCPECGSPMIQDGFKDVTRLIWIPGKWVKRIDRYPVMICPECTDDNGNHISWSEAQLHPNLFENSIVSAEVIAHLAVTTYLLGVPVTRSSSVAEKEEGINLSKQTSTNWLAMGFDQHLESAVRVMNDDYKTLHHAHIDESHHKIVKNRKVRCTNYEIIGCSGRSEEKQMVIYRYSPDRSMEFVFSMLGSDYEGYIQSDGYENYHKYSRTHEKAISVGCWSHVLVKFKEALKVDVRYQKILKLPHEQILDELKKDRNLYRFVYLHQQIQRLFWIEQQLDPKQMSWDEIQNARKEQSAGIVKSIFSTALKLSEKFPVKSKKTVALTYLLNQQEYLQRFLEDGRLELTNLAAERKVKQFVLWRKNSLFSFSEEGARRMSGYMTLLKSAEMNGLHPEKYLCWLLKEMSRRKLTDDDAIRELLPYSKSLPDELQIKPKKSDPDQKNED